MSVESAQQPNADRYDNAEKLVCALDGFLNGIASTIGEIRQFELNAFLMDGNSIELSFEKRLNSHFRGRYVFSFKETEKRIGNVHGFVQELLEEMIRTTSSENASKSTESANKLREYLSFRIGDRLEDIIDASRGNHEVSRDFECIFYQYIAGSGHSEKIVFLLVDGPDTALVLQFIRYDL